MTTPMMTLSDAVDQMIGRINNRKTRLDENSSYYNSEKRPETIGLAVPPAMKKLLAKIGWPRTYIDSLEERLDVEGFRLGKGSDGDDKMWGWWQSNKMDVQSGLAHTEALVHGVAYITVSAPDSKDPLADPTTPVIKVESPKHMYAEIDPATDRVVRAIRVYKDPDFPERDRATLYLPNVTILLVRSSKGPQAWVEERSIKHNLGVVPVIPILNKKRLEETNGCSEIFPELRSQTDSAARLMMNMNATAELMAVPQRVLFGVDQEELLSATQTGASWEAYIANILAFGEANGTVTQLAAAELRNFGDGMTEISKLVAGTTGLPPQYLAFSQDNPASADAIRASESRLVKKCERKARIFGEAWEQVMKVCMLVMGEKLTSDAHKLETVWRDPSTPTYAAKADAVTKLVATTTPDGRSLVPLEQGRLDMGYSDRQILNMEEWDRKAKSSLLTSLLNAPPPAQPPKFSDQQDRSNPEE